VQSETKASNMLFGIGGTQDEINDYITNFINMSDYPLIMNGFHMNNITPIMQNSYFP